MLRNHMLLMFLYAVATAAFFTLLWKTGRRERIRFFFVVFGALFLGGLILGWLMYPAPYR